MTLSYAETKTDPDVRRGYLGGSDAAGVLGLSRWTTPLQVWAIKSGQILPKDIGGQVNVKLGNKLESTVAEFFTEETGKKVRRVNETLFHPDHPFLGANIDRRVVGEEAILECKTTSAWKAKEWSGEDIPQEYIVQVMHYLAVTGAKVGYIAVLIGNQDFKWKVVERDENVIRQMIEKEVHFWNTFIVPKVMPMQMTANDSDVLYQLFPQAIPESVILLDDEANKLIESRNALYQDKIALEKAIDEQENNIKALLGENEAGESGLYKVVWKNQSQQRVDSKKLQSDFPKVYQECVKPIAFRKLTIKAKEA